MNIKMIGLMLVLLVLLLIGWAKIGLAPTLFICAWIILIEAIIFTIRKDYHDAQMKFLNPKSYKILEGKEEGFVLKHRKWSIISLFCSSALMFFISIIIYLTYKMTEDTIPGPNTEGFIGIGIIIFIMVSALILINNIFLKKAQTYTEYLTWSLIVGLVGGVLFMAVIFITAAVYFMFRHQ